MQNINDEDLNGLLLCKMNTAMNIFFHKFRVFLPKPN